MGLADEYEGTTSYDDMYGGNAELWEENITTLKDLDKKDWKKMIQSGTPIPTPETEEYRNTVGAFEGGGYMSKGVYRPFQTCLMREFTTDRFCPVCTHAIRKYIDWLCR